MVSSGHHDRRQILTNYQPWRVAETHIDEECDPASQRDGREMRSGYRDLPCQNTRKWVEHWQFKHLE